MVYCRFTARASFCRFKQFFDVALAKKSPPPTSDGREGRLVPPGTLYFYGNCKAKVPNILQNVDESCQSAPTPFDFIWHIVFTEIFGTRVCPRIAVERPAVFSGKLPLCRARCGWLAVGSTTERSDRAATCPPCYSAQHTDENFDNVTPPALPTGWLATSTLRPRPLWVTSNSGVPSPPADTPPNSALH